MRERRSPMIAPSLPLGVSGHRREKRSLSPRVTARRAIARGCWWSSAGAAQHEMLLSALEYLRFSINVVTGGITRKINTQAARGGKTAMVVAVCSTHPGPFSSWTAAGTAWTRCTFEASSSIVFRSKILLQENQFLWVYSITYCPWELLR